MFPKNQYGTGRSTIRICALKVNRNKREFQIHRLESLKRMFCEKRK